MIVRPILFPFLGLVALGISACGSSTARPPQTSAATVAQAPQHTSTRPAASPPPARRHAAAKTAIDRLTAVAKHQYGQEVYGSVAHTKLRQVVGDPVLRAALGSGNVTQLRAAVTSQFNSVWYHWHVSRVRILRGTRILVDVGVPFVVAGPRTTLRDARGRPVGVLQVSIQDEVGFVRLMSRHHPMEVVVRGQGPAHVRTSLPAAAKANLPRSGTTVIAGRRYEVRSFSRRALGDEPVRVWILHRV